MILKIYIFIIIRNELILGKITPLLTHSKTRVNASPGDNGWFELLRLRSTRSSKPHCDNGVHVGLRRRKSRKILIITTQFCTLLALAYKCCKQNFKCWSLKILSFKKPKLLFFFFSFFWKIKFECLNAQVFQYYVVVPVILFDNFLTNKID